MGKVNYKSIFRIAIPIVIQNFIFASLQLIDSFMIAGVGEKSLAAVTVSSQIYFLVFMLTFGASSGASVFISQYFGAKNFDGIKKTLALNISFTTIFSVLIFIVAYFFSGSIVGWFTNDAEVLSLGIRYLKITSFTYVLIAISFPLELALRAITMARISMIITSISVIINTVLNYMLIYGKFGFSAMGVDGAAKATLIARIIEIILVIYVVYIKDKSLAIRLKDFKSITMEFVKRIVNVAYPVLFNEVIWGLGTIFYLFVFSKYGSKVIVSYQISYQFYIMVEAFMIGFALASQVMIGNSIGENKIEEASELAKVFIKIIIVIAIFSTAVMMLSSGVFVSIFGLSSDTSAFAITIITVISIFNLPRFISILCVVGILRGGGDTKFAFYLEAITMWLINCPILYISVVFFKVPVIYAIVLVHIEDIIKSSMGYYRYRTKKWINNVIE